MVPRPLCSDHPDIKRSCQIVDLCSGSEVSLVEHLLAKLMGMDFPQTRMGHGDPPMPECILFLPLWLACSRTTVLRGFVLTGKMERLIDKFYFDTCSLGELRDEPLWDEPG